MIDRALDGEDILRAYQDYSPDAYILLYSGTVPGIVSLQERLDVELLNGSEPLYQSFFSASDGNTADGSVGQSSMRRSV
ncbi:hypothetical protein TNCT_234171 [Trichonephila clavata]|uniref:Uncharacterized protein n=1 Tax=Trichonephila clavata TaxID=2740835 RepID=A0A8X6L0B9_TRICU|nr:hypothetical protein TNCT_234171 [Trichonephila clavata]